MGKISNLSLQNFRYALRKAGCTKLRTKGGHEMWGRKGLKRSITFQTHVDPVQERIVRQAIGILGITVEEFLAYLD